MDNHTTNMSRIWKTTPKIAMTSHNQCKMKSHRLNLSWIWHLKIQKLTLILKDRSSSLLKSKERLHWKWLLPCLLWFSEAYLWATSTAAWPRQRLSPLLDNAQIFQIKWHRTLSLKRSTPTARYLIHIFKANMTLEIWFWNMRNIKQINTKT